MLILTRYFITLNLNNIADFFHQKLCFGFPPNVMTRDTPRVQEDRSFAGEDDILKALWASAPFPYLPQDAPEEVKKLTINIEDPKQIYVIHNAGRRHHFQLMVER